MTYEDCEQNSYFQGTTEISAHNFALLYNVRSYIIL